MHWLEDFNDRPPVEEPPEPDPQAEAIDPDAPPPADPVADAWKDGFLAGCRINMRNARDDGRDVLRDLARRLAEIEKKLQATADQSAGEMGRLLIDMLRHALPEDCPQAVLDRLQAAVEAVRPVFTLEPRLHVGTEPPGEIGFRDLPGLYRVLETSYPPEWPIGVSWGTAGNPRQSIDVLRSAIGDPA